MAYYDDVKQAAETIRSRVPHVPEIAIVLGSGLGDFAGTLTDAVSMPYAKLPHWPVSNVIGHEGRLVVGTARGKVIAALAGRCHAYEGHDLRTVTFAVRALGLVGVKTLILTNAAGGINTGFSQGALMVIDDHINLSGGNPLVGPNDERFGPRFPDMSEVYSADLRKIADDAGRAINLLLPHGVYAALLGPELRDAGGNPLPAGHWRRRGRHVHGAGGDCRTPHGHARPRHLLHYEHGRRGSAAAARSQRSDGDGAPRPRSVHVAAGGDR